MGVNLDSKYISLIAATRTVRWVSDGRPNTVRWCQLDVRWVSPRAGPLVTGAPPPGSVRVTVGIRGRVRGRGYFWS